MISFFRFSLKLRSFLSLFSLDFQLCVVEFLIKQLFFSGLLDMKRSYNQLGSTRLVGYISFHIQRTLVE